jgi:hypothetical protein
MLLERFTNSGSGNLHNPANPICSARKVRSHRFISIPFALASPVARLLEFLPGAPLTVAEVDLLRDDNVLGTGVLGFEELGITPQNLEDTISHLARPK